MSTHNKSKPDDHWHTVWIGLGGNVGDVQKSLSIALEKMNAEKNVQVTAVSSLYKTPPWGVEDQDWFLNACAKLKTKLAPLELLNFVKDIEVQLQRKKTYRWGPRTIDIDLLIYEGVELIDDRLTLPHPRMSGRAFVLLPLNEIGPNLKVKDKKISECLEQLDLSEIEKVENNLTWQ